MNKQVSIIGALSHGWTTAIANWKIIGLLLCVNLLFSKILIAPYNSLIANITAHRLLPSDISLTYVYDIIQNDKQFLLSATSLMPIVILIYLLWTVFSTGGIVKVVKYRDTHLKTFFSGGVKYFFRYLRLTIYMLILISILGFSIYKLMTWGDINVFSIESEDFLITRFVYCTIIFSVLFTLLKLWNDYLKINIAMEDKPFFFKNAIATWKDVLRLKTLLTFLTNILAVIIVIGLCKLIPNSSTILLFVVTQCIVITRLLYKISNLSSLEYLNKALNRA